MARMKEHQQVEWKESWRDEYLKWLCGFANADGGVLVIGRDDQGKPIGVAIWADGDVPCEPGPHSSRWKVVSDAGRVG